MERVIFGEVPKELSSGYGHGSDYGSGYGRGYGHGSGDGYGYGYGDGYGYGYGDGSGYGYGDGYGSGYGDGSGYGYGDGEYFTAIAEVHGGLRATALKQQCCVLAFWRSGVDGRPSNGGSGEPRQVGTVEEEKGPLVPCKRGALHGTLQPQNWKGERLWIVALYPPVEKVDDDKFASLKREILAEIPNFLL